MGVCEHAVLFLLGNECWLAASYATALEKQQLFTPISPCDLGREVPKPGPQFTPFQNAEYSYAVSSLSTRSP